MPTSLVLALLILSGTILEVQVMTTPSELRRGLQGHRPLAQDEGMLFVLSEVHDAQFWMKDVTFPIDIVFIRPEGSIANIHAAVPPCKTKRCPVYASDGPVSHALELAAGMAARHGLATGSLLRLDIPGRAVELPATPATPATIDARLNKAATPEH